MKESAVKYDTFRPVYIRLYSHSEVGKMGSQLEVNIFRFCPGLNDTSEKALTELNAGHCDCTIIRRQLNLKSSTQHSSQS